MSYTEDELISINELKTTLNVKNVELKNILSSEEEVLESVEELKKVFFGSASRIDDIERETYNEPKELIFQEKEETYSLKFLGEKLYHPEHACRNNLYRNSQNGTVYIYTTKWEVFLKDGESNSFYGGGLGERDVITIVKDIVGNFDGNVKSSNVEIDYQYSNITGNNLNEILSDIDSKINVDSFSGTLGSTNILIDNNNLSVITGNNLQESLEKIDRKIVSNVIFGNYKTHDVVEDGDIVYVGNMNTSGDWYIKKVVTDILGDISIRYTNNYASSVNYDYTSAFINKTELNYVPLSGLGVI